MPASRLNELQLALLAAFFAREQRFFLTGGAALAGFHLGHRTTEDLDFFTSTASLDEGDRALAAAAADIGGRVEILQTFPDYRSRLVKRGDDSVEIDLVRDQAVPGHPERVRFGAIIVDSPEEILANKLCTLLSRAELRDYVDVLTLERSGLRMEDALPLAALKDAGLTPLQLAFVLSEVRIGDDAKIPAGVSVQELREFIRDLQSRLAKLSFPRRG